MKKTWMIQIDLGRDAMECPVWLLRKKLAGSGIEVDRTYPPTFVGKGRFVGRGFATERAAARIRGYRRRGRGPTLISNGGGRNDVVLFPELGLEAADLARPD